VNTLIVLKKRKPPETGSSLAVE